LHCACLEIDSSPVIPFLLAHPDINVNANSKDEYTPFYLACENGYTSCVRELLKDSRVKVTEPDGDGRTPLWRAACWGYLDIVEWWIASGREMDLGRPGDGKTDAIGVAKKIDPWHSAVDKRRRAEIATLLERFKSDATQTRHEVRVELGLLDDLAAEMFALVVFVSDGLLQINGTTTPSPAARFFKIATQLPLELQMVLCFRQVGSGREIIPGKVSEVAFKGLARRLLWSLFFI